MPVANLPPPVSNCGADLVVADMNKDYALGLVVMVHDAPDTVRAVRRMQGLCRRQCARFLLPTVKTESARFI